METEEIEKTLVEHAGYFDLSRLYQLLYDLYSTMGYDVYERNYYKDEGDGVIQIVWECYKPEDNYTRFKMGLRIFYGGFGEGKVNMGGKTVELNTGDIEVHLSSYLETDYRNEWENHPILRYLRRPYERFLYRDVLDTYDGKIEDEFWYLAGEIKSFFEQYSQF